MATPEEVATTLHTTKAGLAQMRYRGEGPQFVRVGRRRILYRWEDVEAWLAASTCTRSDQ
ncbi:helix-turn-helix transcriptional regulator [Mycobacterium sp. 29Ha]|uniref:helix-turn-helix transcriptional regulator n=1 Tax=Mycobacterium sp. 29Ha TaxID=2939268 RepID=UPI0039779D31